MPRRWIALACALLATRAVAQTMPTTTSRPTTSPADVARVAALGGVAAVSCHDPSTVVRDADGTYHLFGTGMGIKSWTSTDLMTWRQGPPVFARPLPWLADAVPGQRGYLWAPDVIRLDDGRGERWLLYYSVSTFGKNRSAIGLAEARSLGGEVKWEDRGIVVRSTPPTDEFNAIDPSVFRDPATGRLWLAFGSFWGGIQLIELDPATGQRKGGAIRRVAWQKEIEAATLHAHGGKYFLFVNWGLCCRGVRSTYEIRVGRADSVEGPYLDRDGVDLAKGGGTPVLSRDGPFVGPGHAGIVVSPDGKEQLTGHYYDATDAGRSHLFVRPLAWDDDGWPKVD